MLIIVRYITLFQVVSDVCSFLTGRFSCGAHHSNVPITPLDRDSGADPFDEADFELPDEKR